MVDGTGEGSRVRRSRAAGALAVVDAAVNVLVREGLDGLSVRKVAAEAGISVGAVQHHYASKTDLLVASAEHVTTQFTALAETLTQQALEKQGPEMALAAFCELLANASPEPEGTGDDTTATIIWLWYAAKATRPGAVAEAFAVFWSRTEEYLADAIARIYPVLDATEEAAYLLAVLDGIAVARASEPQRMPFPRARKLVHRHLRFLSEQQIAQA